MKTAKVTIYTNQEKGQHLLNVLTELSETSKSIQFPEQIATHDESNKVLVTIKDNLVPGASIIALLSEMKPGVAFYYVLEEEPSLEEQLKSALFD